MDLHAKIRTLPTTAGVYLYKNAEGEVIYVGKAKNLRSRVSSYFHEGRVEDAKTGTLVREAVDVDYIIVANNKEALALENHLIKQKKPRFNILLRDDKTYPYIKLCHTPTAERWQRLLRAIFPCQPGLPDRGFDSQALSDSLVQGRPQPLPSASVPAVLHQALCGTLR